MLATITSALDALLAAQARNHAAETARASTSPAPSAETTTTRRGATKSERSRAPAASARGAGGKRTTTTKGAKAGSRDKRADPVEEASQESFPASDPPAFNP